MSLGRPSSSGARVLPSPGGKVALAGKTRPSFVKRQRERDQKQRRRLKDERRMQRRVERAARPDTPGDRAPEVQGIPAEPIPVESVSAEAVAPLAQNPGEAP